MLAESPDFCGPGKLPIVRVFAIAGEGDSAADGAGGLPSCRMEPDPSLVLFAEAPLQLDLGSEGQQSQRKEASRMLLPSFGP